MSKLDPAFVVYEANQEMINGHAMLTCRAQIAIGADFAFDIHGGQREAFICTLGGHPERMKRLSGKLPFRDLLELREVWRVKIERDRFGEKEVRHSAGPSETFHHLLRRDLVWNGNPNAPLQRFDPPNLQVAQRQAEVTHESLLEEIAVTALEGEFVVVDDCAVHSLGR